MPRTLPDTPQNSELRERAAALRRAGKSRLQIKEILGLASNWTLNELLRGTVPAGSPLRVNAKDELHKRARDLRAQGMTYAEIAAELGVSKSSISLWVRDLPRQGRLSYEESRKRNAEGSARYWSAERSRREAARRAISDVAAAQVGALTDRELLIAGAVAYWCEGAKNKPHRQDNHVTFINSDPGLIRLFLRFTEAVGIARERLYFRVHIHESADVAAAEAYWLALTGADRSQFRRSTLKSHNPRSARHNTGDGYRGCLRIDVRESIEFYRQIEGWVAAALGTVP